MEHKTFIVYVAAFSVNFGNKVYLFKKAQIPYLKVDKAPIKVPSKYTDFENVFSVKLTKKFSKHMEIKNHAIELIDNQQPPYGLIKNLRPIELEMLKIYIKNNLASGFIRPFKSFARVPMLFDKKPDRNQSLYVNY